MKQLPVLVLKQCVGASLYNIFVPGGFGQRVGSDMSMSHIFPRGVLAAFTFVGSGAEIEVLEPAPSVSRACSVSRTLFSAASTNLLEQKPRGSDPSWLHPLHVFAPSPPSICTPTSVGDSAGAKKWVLGVGWELWLFQSQAEPWPTPHMLPLQAPAMAVLAPFRCILALRRLRPAQPCPLLGRCSTSPSVKLCC